MNYNTSFVCISVLYVVCGLLCSAQNLRVFGDFSRAHAVCLDPQGNVYVADGGTNTILKFDGEGKLLASIGGYGWGQLEFDQPYDVCATNGLDVFVADYGNHRIQRYNRKLEYIGTLYTRESSNELQRFGYPKGIAINRFGDLFVCDTENRRVLKISGFTRVVSSIGGIDAGKGRLVDPKALDVDSQDNLYVLETNRIVVFDNFGNYLRTLGTDKLRSASGFCVAQPSVFVAQEDTVLEFTLEGTIGEAIPCSDYVRALVSSDADIDRGDCVDVAADQSRLIVVFGRFAVIAPR